MTEEELTSSDQSEWGCRQRQRQSCGGSSSSENKDELDCGALSGRPDPCFESDEEQATPEDIISPMYFAEYAGLRFVQRAYPHPTNIALIVHYAVSEKVLTPLLALLVWLISLPSAASTISCICFSQSLNTIIKWFFQRPRPFWMVKKAPIVNVSGAWQGDFSFPSAHTQFFAGFALCCWFVFELPQRWLTPAISLGAIAGLTRNYLAVHWCSDTLVGWLLGSAIGFGWGLVDPYRLLVERSDLSMSISVACGIVTVLLVGLQLSRSLAPSIGDAQRAQWFKNAIGALPEDQREVFLTKALGKFEFKDRRLESIVPELTSIWWAFAFTGVYSKFLPPDALKNCMKHSPPPSVYFYRMLVGLSGLLIWLVAMVAIKSKLLPKGTPAGTRGGCKILWQICTFTGVCFWTFLLSPLVLQNMGLSCAAHFAVYKN